ncbi:GNAT family N-acetyltransferase [Kitasatospora sp. RB6PN24]|uniref:GNAT family N-acetyltransferase n=1 Tax=Kitasatospora humi TaxID=2893891 RepID=UPI001E375544|nr:GNAT family N-acetyltransferase [Kitasatospora humi]MCC9305806.1 GNAT family N-acetyltransferase [Kitasatospora humi]
MTKLMRAVRLEPMTEDEFGPWADPQIARYAEAKVRAGAWSPEEAPAKSRENFHRYLSKGLATPGHHVWVARDGVTGERVGTLWLEIRSSAAHSEAYVCYVEVDETHRGKGYGRAVMDAGAEAARRLGAASMALNVFEDNTTAYNLYSALGYRTTSRIMRLEL